MSTTLANQKQLFGHPIGLYVLFFTEMWERFSYYGMRAILVLYLVSSTAGDNPGLGWSNGEALALYGWYTMMVYVMSIPGGIIADKWLGQRKSVLVGSLLLVAGHGVLAIEEMTAFYSGLVLIVLGVGMLKPNISTMVGGLYKQGDIRRDKGFTIFYIGINLGAFLSSLIVGYVGEVHGWHYGFGLAGIFMFLGMLQFWFAQGIFGSIGLSPSKAIEYNDAIENADEKSSLVEEKVPANVQRDRYIVVGILAFFTVFFWAAFEQAGGSMTIFAGDYTNRVLEGDAANIFRVANTLLTVVPLLIITYVLFQLFKITFKKYALSNIFLGTSFAIIWCIVIWMLKNQFSDVKTEVPASWFSILNSFYIIAFAPLISKIWESKFNPPATVKFGMGLVLLGLGFGVLAYGASEIPQGAQTASVSMIWLILAYLLHTLGELCLSPVGLSYVSKLVPASTIGVMFGLWYIAVGMGNKAAGSMGGMIDKITAAYDMSTFFLIFTIVPMLAGFILMALTPMIKKLMHGVK